MQSVSKEQVDNLRSRFNVLAKSIHLEEHQFELSELKMRQQNPEFWSDTDAAQEHVTNRRGLKTSQLGWPETG